MIEKSKVEHVLTRLSEVETLISAPGAAADPHAYRDLMREHASLRRLQERAAQYYRLLDRIEADRPLAADESGDPELREMAAAELAESEAALPAAEKALSLALLPPDPDEHRNAILEIRAGTGGDEAALFAGDLFRMYSRYAESKGWKVSVLDSNEGEAGGFKEVIATITGEGVYGRLKFESGTHRVQRVPATEAQGRIHTSAATVLLLPEADEEDDLDIPDSDLRIDIFCAGGHGGQGVNTTYSAVRITHLPTGLVAQCQDERSQLRNKEKCMAVLKARILDQRRSAEEAKDSRNRRDLAGNGDRSQKIRTYNYPQNRITDHRVGYTAHNLSSVMDGDLDLMLDALHEHDLAQRLEAELAE